MSLKQIILKIEQRQKIVILLGLKDGRLIAYTDHFNDRKIHVFNKSMIIAYTIKDIKSMIRSMIETEDNKLICCSYEITIIKLNKYDYEIIQIIKEWSNKVIEITEFNKLLFSQNNSLCFYQSSNNSNQYKLDSEIKFDKNINNMLKLNQNELALMLDDYFKNISINIYNLSQRKLVLKLYEIKAKESGDMCIINNNKLIVSFYLFLVLIDIENYKVLHEIRTSFGCVNSFCYFKEFIFFSGDDIGDVIEWKIKNNKIIKIKEYNNGKKAINSIIKYKENSIIVGSDDGFINFYISN